MRRGFGDTSLLLYTFQSTERVQLWEIRCSLSFACTCVRKSQRGLMSSLRAFSLIVVSMNERRKILDSNNWEKLPEWSVWCLIFSGYNRFKLIYPHKIKNQHPSQLVTYPWGLILIQTFWCSIQTLKCQADRGRCFTACFTLPFRRRELLYEQWGKVAIHISQCHIFKPTSSLFILPQMFPGKRGAER